MPVSPALSSLSSQPSRAAEPGGSSHTHSWALLTLARQAQPAKQPCTWRASTSEKEVGAEAKDRWGLLLLFILVYLFNHVCNFYFVFLPCFRGGWWHDLLASHSNYAIFKFFSLSLSALPIRWQMFFQKLDGIKTKLSRWLL